jgi:hypothetical protein
MGCGAIHRLWAILCMNLSEWKAKIDRESAMGCITFTLTKHLEMDDRIYSRRGGSKSTYPCIPFMLPLEVLKQVLVGIRF